MSETDDLSGNFRILLERRKPSGGWELVGHLADLLTDAELRRVVLALAEIDTDEFDALSSTHQAEVLSALRRGEPPSLTPPPATVH